MNIFIRIKAAGKRRDMLEKRPQDIPGDLKSAEEFIAALVRENVRTYNEKAVEAPFFHYLSKQELEDGEQSGKIGFGDRKNENKQDEEDAVRNALQCFADGIYRVLINENEVLSGGAFSIKEGDTVTFIRLVMLAGRRF